MRNSRTSHRHKKSKKSPTTTDQSFSRQQFTQDDLKDLDIAQLMCEKFGWEEAKPFQVEATRSQLVGENVMVHASTGSGKTAIAAGPHAMPGTEGEVTLFVAPLLSLHTEMTKTFQEKYHLSTIAVNSLIEGGTKKIFKDIVDGKYQIVILAPEMLLHRRFVDAVMKSQRFRQRLRSVVIDEAHCISHWGDNFRKAYGALGMVRAFLLPHTSIVAMSGTLTRRVRRHVCKKLGFLSTRYTNINEGNGRANISLISLQMEHPADSFRDANILIPPNIQHPDDIPKTFVYCDEKDTIYDMVDHLRAQLPSTIDPGVIRPFTASQSAKYRSDAMAAFSAGAIRILVCTEAAGMGCDIPGVKRAAQWKTPKTSTNAVQRGGRPARNPNEEGVYIQFNEPASYRVNPTEAPVPKPKKVRSSGKRKGKQKGNEVEPEVQPVEEPTGATKPASAGFKSDVPAEPELREDSPGEGIYCFVQTTLCRRQVLDKVFGNLKYDLKVPCCDLCDPTLLDHFHLPPPQKANRAPRLTKYELSEQTVKALKEWRDLTFEVDYPTANYDSDGFMDDGFIKLLSSVDPAVSLETLTASVDRQWEHWSKYKDRIYAIISSINTESEGHLPSSCSESPESTIKHGQTKAHEESPAKRLRLSAPSRQGKRSAARKPEKLSEYETRLEWEVQAQASCTEESQGGIETQTYSQSIFSLGHSQPHPPTPSPPQAQHSMYPADVSYPNDAQAGPSNQPFAHPLAANLGYTSYHRSSTPTVPSQPRSGAHALRSQRSKPAHTYGRPYMSPSTPRPDSHSRQASLGCCTPTPTFLVPLIQHHPTNPQPHYRPNGEWDQPWGMPQAGSGYGSDFAHAATPQGLTPFTPTATYGSTPMAEPQIDPRHMYSQFHNYNY